MTEAKVSGPPRIVGWGSLGPILEVPLSIAPDWIWIEALHRTPHEVSHVVRWDTDDGRLLVESATEDLAQTCEWLIKHVGTIAEVAEGLREKARVMEADLGQWWVDR